MRNTKIKQFVLLVGLLLPVAWCGANATYLFDGYSNIAIQNANVHGMPKGSSILASIDGHYLSVVFTENLGQVIIEVSSTTVGEVETQVTPTPNGVNIYIINTGNYLVTFTLSNGDVYYGEFEVRE